MLRAAVLAGAPADGVAGGRVKAGRHDDEVGRKLVRDGQDHVRERRQVVACAADTGSLTRQPSMEWHAVAQSTDITNEPSP